MTLLTVTPREVRQDWIARREIALLDLREEDPFARAHPLFASQLPLSRLELEILDRVPRKDAKIVLYDNGEGLVSPAGKRLAALGYTQIRALAGGLQGWKDAGYELFQDVNSYSKAFGELVEARRHTPSLPAQEVQARIDRGADQVILDSRRFEEYAS
jgi:rhodanese-related sulfurtransferase